MIDELSYELGKRAASGGGGGGEAVLIDKTISTNGTYNASSDNADGYKKAVVNVPNSYAAGDEGKVVSNGALVAQGSDTVTENGTVDTTLINSLLVNVSGGGGSSYTLLAETDFTVDTVSTSSIEVGTIACGSSAYTTDRLIYVRVRDKAGRRNGYYYGGDVFVAVPRTQNESNSQVHTAISSYVDDSGKNYAVGGTYGILAKKIDDEGNVYIAARYNANNTKTINGTFHVEVYRLSWPDGVSPYTT